MVAKLGGSAAQGTAFQIDSLDTGWSSGRVALKDGATIEVPLAKPGENLFKVFVFDAAGGSVRLAEDKIAISRTAAQIDAIPASHSIGVEAREKIGGRVVLDYLVREGDQLPKGGNKTFKAEESLRAGAAGSIKFKLWEGAIEDPVSDNRFVGMFEIKGSDFSDGVIAKGADLLCKYEVRDSGNIVLEVSVPSIGGLFHSGRNFYSRLEGQIDYTKAAKRIQDESERVGARLQEVAQHVDDSRLDQARKRVDRASRLGSESDAESAKQAMDDVQEAKKLLAQARKQHLPVIRRIELNKAVEFFDSAIRQFARPAEAGAFDNLAKTAQRAIDHNSGDFESLLDEMRRRNFLILWRQDWFVMDRLKWLSDRPFEFPDAAEHEKLCRLGRQAAESNDMDTLRQIVGQLDGIRVITSSEDDMLAGSNILVG